jgi:hypothetical protein
MHCADEHSSAAVIAELFHKIAVIEAEIEVLVILYDQLKLVLSGKPDYPGHNTPTAASI